MAFKTYELDESDRQTPGSFFNFKNVGDVLQGYYVDKSPSRSNYAKEGDVDMRFVVIKPDKTKEIVKLSPVAYDVRKKLEKAEKAGDLKQGALCRMKLAKLVQVPGYTKPVWNFEVMVDPEVKPAIAEGVKKMAAAPVAAPKPSTPPADENPFDDAPATGKPATDEDVPF